MLLSLLSYFFPFLIRIFWCWSETNAQFQLGLPRSLAECYQTPESTHCQTSRHSAHSLLRHLSPGVLPRNSCPNLVFLGGVAAFPGPQGIVPIGSHCGLPPMPDDCCIMICESTSRGMDALRRRRSFLPLMGLPKIRRETQCWRTAALVSVLPSRSRHGRFFKDG